MHDLSDSTNWDGYVKEIARLAKLQNCRFVATLRQAFLEITPMSTYGILHFVRYKCDLEAWVRDVLPSESPPDSKVRPFSFQMVQAVAYIHEVGIVHGDLKPLNVLVDESGKFPHLRLCDFETSLDRGVGGVTATHE